MLARQKKKRLPLKTVYYLSFLCFIVIPILIVLIAALLILNQQFKRQAMDTMEQAQETIITELSSDINVMSMRLSHLIYTNNNEILGYAAGTDTSDRSVRYQYEQKLTQAGNLVLEPVKDIISVGFYMKGGRETYIKTPIKRFPTQIQESSWYQAALAKPNSVYVGSYDTDAMNDLYTGGKKDSLILVFALAPDITTDRSGKVEMVSFYQSTKAAERIKKYNLGYLNDSNKLGITQITDRDGNLLFSTHADAISSLGNRYTCVKSPIVFQGTTWYVESYIKTSDLTSDFWDNALWILFVAILVLSLAGYYSRYFLRSIVTPVEEISSGLRQVEEGNLEVYVTPNGQFEVRTMIHQFNAMVRRLKALIFEYEERVKNGAKNPQDYFAAMLTGDLSPEEVNEASKDFFMEHYALLGFFIEYGSAKGRENEFSAQLIHSFERNSRFASRCIPYMENNHFFFIFYRITENDYVSKVSKMSEELQKMALKDFQVQLSVCIGCECFGHASFQAQVLEIHRKMPLRHLVGNHSLIDLNTNPEFHEKLLQASVSYHSLAKALYTADEKALFTQKESLFEALNHLSMEESAFVMYAAILAIGEQFTLDNSSFAEVFGQPYNYVEKISRISDLRSLKLWIANYFAWIMDYSASKLNLAEADVITKAKRYLLDHYEDANLSLLQVAEYVDLNEKYFTNRFTKETGETFSSYLIGLRMQKAKELLKSTNFKVYEIAEMVGYHNVEHFNRMFKKLNNLSPVQYRKT